MNFDNDFPTTLINAFLSTCLAILLVVAIGNSPARAGSGLVRLTDREDLLGWEAVGRLELAGQGFCTATLIAADLILTAAHCVFDKRTGARFPIGDITFRAGLRDGVSVAERQVSHIAVDPGFDPRGQHSIQRIRKDVALMRLRNPITVADAYPFVLHSGKLNSTEVSVSSYGQGRADAISRQRTCRLLYRSQGMMAFDCDVTFGSSGSAVFAKVGNRGRILSVVSALSEMDGKKVALGMELPAIVNDLKQQLRVQTSSLTAPLPPNPIRQKRSGISGAKFIKP